MRAFLADDALFESYHADYLFRKERARQLVVDTNSLLIDILPGDGSALETFKLAHRAIDVQKAMAEAREAEVEARRREKRVVATNLDDPDTERVIIFGPPPVPAVPVGPGSGKP